MGFFSWLVTPDEALNYRFLAGIYALLSFASAGLFVAQYVFEVDHLTGWWIIPAPAAPGLLYVLLLNSLVAKKELAAPVETKKTK